MKAKQSKVRAAHSSGVLFCSLLVGVFFVLGVIGLWHHPMWRDELFPWLMARFSGSLRDLCLVARYDTHFMLWHLVLWILSRFTHNCEALQWLHLALATCGVWMVVRLSPFTRTQKVLYCFGYFTFFEYCVVCREYVCVGLLMFSLCVLRDRRKDSFVLQALILFLLSNINVFATFIAFSFVAASIVEHIRRGDLGQLWVTKKRALIISGLILCAAVLSDGLQSIKPPDARAFKDLRHSIGVQDFVTALGNVWRGYVPIPRPFPHYLHVWRGDAPAPQDLWKLEWGSNFLLDIAPGHPTLGVLLSLGLLAASTWTLRRSPMAVAWYLSGTCLMLLFQSVVALGALRHHGLYFILYLACLWCRSSWAATHERRPAAADSQPARLEHFFLLSLFSLQVVAGVYVWIIHFQTPFSSSKRAADFIRRNGYANMLIVGAKEAKVSPVTAYLDRPIYYPDSAREGTFQCETTANRDLSGNEVLSGMAQLARTEYVDVLLVFSRRLMMPVKGGSEPLKSAWLFPNGRVAPLSEPPTDPDMQISLLAEFRAIVDESYSLYLIHDVHGN
jgi:hypothetical protein